MKRLGWVLMVVLVTATLGWSAELYVPEQTITQLKTYYPDTILVENGQATCIIIHPAGDGYADLAAQVAAAIKAATGAEVPVKSDKEYSEADHATNLICLGRMNNNKLAFDLYVWHYVACDDWFPGPGDKEHPPGFVVRSCCDPWGTGKNVIMLGGTELDGVKLAVEHFKGLIVNGKTLTIPRTVEVRFKGTENVEELAKTIEPYYHKNFIDLKALPYQAENKMVSAAEGYFLTGRNEYLKCYALMMRRWMDEYYKWIPGRQITTPKYIIPFMLLGYDQLEESPLLPDDLKLEMTNLLYDYVSRMSVHGRITQLKPGVLASSGLHNVSMTVIYGGKYFKKYYPDADFERIDKGIAFVNVGQQTMANSNGIIDNDGGYTIMYARTAAMLAPAMNNYQFFESGAARKYMEYCFITTGTLGNAFFGMHGPQPTPGIIAWYCKDPTYAWYHNWRHEMKTYYPEMTTAKINTTLWSYMPNMEERVPEEMIGLHYMPIHETNYAQYQREGRLVNVPRERAFHQLCMRTGFTPDDQYLRLDGINDGIDNGGDGNAIPWITQGEDWLTETGKWGGARNMKYHSTCLVLRDGQMSDKRVALCDLQVASELPNSGFVRSVMHKYNGMDWARNIVWIKGKYWVVFDQLQVLEADDYSVLCQWMGAGDEVSKDYSTSLTSKEHTFYLQAAGGNRPLVKAIEPGDDRPVFRQSINGQLAVGDEPTFATMFYGRPKAEPNKYTIKRISQTTCVVTEPDRQVLVGVAPLGKPEEAMVLGPGVEVKCTMFALAADEMSVCGLTSFGGEQPMLETDKPIDLAVNFTTGVVTAQAAEPTELKVRGLGGEQARAGGTMQLEAGPQRVPAKGALLAALAEAVRGIVAKAATAPAQISQAAQIQYPQKLQMKWEFQVPAQDKVSVRCLETTDLDGDGSEEVLVGTSDGRVILVKADGSSVGETFFQAEGGINDIAVTDFGEGNRILVASDDEHLYCLDGAGLEWKFTGRGIVCTNQAPGTYGVGRYIEGDGEMVAIEVADINADGTKEVLVGSKTFKHGPRVFGTLWCLTPAGKLLWHLYESAGTINSVNAFDDTGDGQMKIAIESGGRWYGVGGYIVDNEGNMLSRQTAGYGDRFCDVAKIAADGGYRKVRTDHRTGITDVFETAEPYARKWSFRASGLSATGPAVTDLDGNGIAEILVGSGGGSLFCLNEAAQPLTWRLNLGEPISALAVGAPGGSGVQVIAGANTGGVYVVSAEGKRLAHAEMAGPVSCVATARFQAKGNETVIAATEQGALAAFNLQ